MELILAIILGTAFGYILFSIGASDGNILINMLRLRDSNLMKTILLGIGIAAVLTFVSHLFGILDPSHFDIKKLTVGVIVGGALFGVGWGVSGYCPGTSVAALGSFKKDALVYIIGGLVGAGIFTLLYNPLKEMGLFNELLGGEVSLFKLTSDSLSIFNIGPIGGIILGALFISIAVLIPMKIIKKD